MASIYYSTNTARNYDYYLQISNKNALNANINCKHDLSNELQDFVITAKDCYALKQLFDDPIVVDFLSWDTCYMLADKYLLATAVAYLKRANIKHQQYTPINLFVALYLAHDMQEDLDIKNDLIRFAMGNSITSANIKLFLRKRDKLWHSMAFRAGVNSVCCDNIMTNCLPNHAIWKRERSSDHGGVSLRNHIRYNVIKELHLVNSYVECKIRCIICAARRHLAQTRRSHTPIFDVYNHSNQNSSLLSLCSMTVPHIRAFMAHKKHIAFKEVEE